MEEERRREKTALAAKPKKVDGNLIAFAGAAALIVIAVNIGIAVIKSRHNKKKRKDLPGSNVRVNLSASEILKLADRIIANSKKVHDSVASVPLDKVSYTNVIAPLADLESQQFPLVQSCIFPKLVTYSDDVRKASGEAERRIDAHVSMCRKREDVYRVIKAFAARREWMNPETEQYIQCLVRDFERNGLNLTLTKREELQRLKAQIDELSMQYVQILSNDGSFLLFDATELQGLPQEFLESLEKVEKGKMKVTLRSNHVLPVLEACKVGKTRRMLASAYGQRCGEVSLSVLEKLVQMRHKFAQLLGYSNYANYIVDVRMAKTSSKVFDFLEDISASLNDLAARELQILKDLKKKEEGEVPFGIEDLTYYVKRFEERQFNLDFGVIKQYFPVNLVISGMFKINQDLFGLRFEEIIDADVWHQDIHLYSVLDLSSSELLGYFYLDLYSRAGKYGHTCVLPLQNGSLLPNGSRQIPVSLLIAQFQKEDGGHSGLLRFSEVTNLFHEFGHVDITKPIKDETCKSLQRWRHSFSALKLKQEIIHSAENVNFVELFKHLHSQVMLDLPMLEGINPASCFPRSAIGYEGACYSRIWSEAFAADIFASKFSDNLQNQFIGMQFRNKVLALGGAKDPVVIISDFLGREPSIRPFLDKLEWNL
ncbi:Peptidase M3A/M3B catalytic domain [Dillenia turbinata]|uniref:Peptidase M3A/M3B catalytic domain n=1 Tax=Dillenia turbinata TaxID=194707 RepID=A0AAN8Z4H3_9MAGN